MNRATAKILVDELVSDVADVVGTDPRRDVCIWWRGRLSVVADTVKAVADDVDLRKVEAALDALIEAEEMGIE